MDREHSRRNAVTEKQKWTVSDIKRDLTVLKTLSKTDPVMVKLCEKLEKTIGKIDTLIEERE